eukprot:2482792-Alexandrium_andersonii.AAC.1
MLDGVPAPHAHASARRPPSPQAPSKVGVNERAEGGTLTLPRKMVNAPGTDHQVADQPDKSCPIR